MNNIYELPPILRGSAENQLAQLRDYLVRMARQGAESAATVPPGGAAVPAAQTTAAAQSAEDARRQYAALRALIVKTAERQAADKAALRLELAAENGVLSAHVYRGARELTADETAALGRVVWLREGEPLPAAEELTPGLAADESVTARLERRDAPLEGEALSFTEALARPVRGLAVDFGPERAGSAQDDARLVLGRTGLRLCRTGKNLLIPRWDDARSVGGVTFTRNADGSVRVSGTSTAGTLFAPGTAGSDMFRLAQPLRAGFYTLRQFGAEEVSGVYFWLRRFDRDGNVIGRALATNNAARATVFEMPSDGYVFLRLYVADSGVSVDADVGAVLTRNPASAETFEPPRGEQLALSWETEGGTVCGGTLELTTGELTVTWFGCALTDAEGFTNPRPGTFRKRLPAQRPYRRFENNGAVTVNARCDRFPIRTSDSVTAQSGYLNFYNYRDPALQAPVIYLRPEDGTLADLAAFSDWIAENPVRFCFELETPFTISLGGRALETLAGANELWCDGGTLRLTAATVLARAENRPAQRLHIRYSDDGETFTADGGRTVGAWIGTRADFSEQASEVFSDYVWRRFADDRELSGRLGVLESGVGELSHTMRADYVALSDFGAYAQQVTADIDANARAITETHNYAELVSAAAAAGVRGELTQYMSRVDGQIRRGFIADPDDPGSYVYGIAVSQKLRFTGATRTVDGELCWELDGAQTFGLYTSTGWQFWVGGRKIGWFDSADGMLHVTQMAAEQELRLGADWLVTGAGGFGVRCIGG